MKFMKEEEVEMGLNPFVVIFVLLLIIVGFLKQSWRILKEL